MAVSAALLLGAAVAAPAHAALAPSVTATLVDEGLDAQARRVVRVEVSGTCGPAASPGTEASVEAWIAGRWAHDEHKPFRPDYHEVEPLDGDAAVPGSSATFRYRLSGGLRASARARLYCLDELAGESAQARSDLTAAVQAPVWLRRWELHGKKTRYKRLSCRPREGFEVGAGHDVQWHLGLNPKSVFGTRALRVQDIPRITLHLRGGGTRAYDFHPSIRGFKLFGGLLLNGFYWTARKARPVRLWVTVGGLDSNVMVAKVRPKPRGC